MNAPVISDVTSAGLLSRRLTTDLAAPQRLWWELIGSLFERYRPELHYARGDPGLFSLVERSVRLRASYRDRMRPNLLALRDRLENQSHAKEVSEPNRCSR
jgi:hypothetical protein